MTQTNNQTPSYGYKNLQINYGVHVVFSTIPHQIDSNFETDIENHYFDNYRKDINSEKTLPFLYKPLKFYMLGDYDVCYISLINNFKFSHRLFEPKSNNSNKIYNSHTFQSYSGFALNKKNNLEDLFSIDIYKKKPISYFVGIIHLKLNNGLFIGNGLNYIEKINSYISKFLDDLGVHFILNQTFSWFELSLVVFINNPQTLTDILFKLRLSKFEDLYKYFEKTDIDSIKESSLYSEILNPNDQEKILKTSLFADTNSHFGFNERLIKNHFEKDENDINKNIDPYLIKFQKVAKKINLKTEIEWQVKPGHIKEIINLIKDNDYLKEFFINKKIKNDNLKTNMVLGKCDYLIQETNSSILSNFHLIRNVNFERKDACKFFKHARKVRTYIFLEPLGLDDIITDNSEPISWQKTLSALAVTTGDFKKNDDALKALKVSRQIRTKILKIFSNYNNGILDPILFPYFLDFKIFIDNLKELISKQYDISTRKIFPLENLEKDLNNYIVAFEEGYIVRFLNGYQFENICDFDLDFNNSIQQLLSCYGTMIYEYGKLFYKDKYYPILQLNDTDTVSDYLSIHYFGHHLTSPEFIFASLTKEILNHVKIDDKEYKKLFDEFNLEIHKIKVHFNESYFDDMFEMGLIDINYFVIDAIRYKLTYNSNFEIYEHWFWTYHFQNSHNYNSNGSFNEQRLKMEMFRLLLIYKIYVLPSIISKIEFNKKLNINEKINTELKCPSPEIYTHWEKHYMKIDLIVENIVQYSKIDKENNLLHKIFLKVEEIYKKTNSEGKYDLPIKHFNANDLLRKHFDLNKKKLTALKRNWVDGTILDNHKDLYNDIYYAIDATGGIFFYDCAKMQQYFTQNAECLLSVIDFSTIHKKTFITTNCINE